MPLVWMEMYDATNYSSPEVYMSSEANYRFNINVRLVKKIENEPFHSIKDMFDIYHMHVLLNKNLFLALKELASVVADYLRELIPSN
jgi:hypothetical protein